MKLNKPISEYTVPGLLFLAAQTHDDELKTVLLTELRKRKREAAACGVAADINREQREGLKYELEIEGLRSKDEQTRRRANRDLFAQMKDRAFMDVEIPEGLSPAETVRRYNRDIHSRAKARYAEFKAAAKPQEIASRRRRVQSERAAYYETKAAAKRAEIDRDRHPLTGLRVYYTDVLHDGRQVGVIRGVKLRKAACTHVLRIETPDGGRVDRAISAVAPVDDQERFDEAAAPLLATERTMRTVCEVSILRRRAAAYLSRIRELEATLGTSSHPEDTSLF